MKFEFDSLHGAVIRSHSLGGLTLSETAYQPHLNLPRHSHPAAYFCFVLEGSFTEIYGKRSRGCGPSTLVFHPADETHSDRFYTATRCFNLQMEARWTERIPRYSAMADNPADFREGFLPQLATRLYREFRDADDLSPLVIEGLTLEILAEAVRGSKEHPGPAAPPPRWLALACELLNEQFHENLSLTKVAAAVGVHETHLSREFRRFYRCTVGEYVRRRRIENACRRLASSEAPLAEIALAAGFYDQSHFARTFKSQTGMTPQEYRRVLRSR